MPEVISTNVLKVTFEILNKITGSLYLFAVNAGSDNSDNEYNQNISRFLDNQQGANYLLRVLAGQSNHQ